MATEFCSVLARFGLGRFWLYPSSFPVYRSSTPLTALRFVAGFRNRLLQETQRV